MDHWMQSTLLLDLPCSSPWLQSCGSTCVLVAVEHTLVGVIAVMDPIKPEAR